AFAVVAGCSKQGAEPVQDAGKDRAAELREKKLELTIYSQSAYPTARFDPRFGDPIRAQFPNWKINYIQHSSQSSLEQLLTAGQKIDLIYDSVGLFLGSTVKYNLQYDMSRLIAESKVDLNRFEPTAIDAMKSMSDGGMYGLPIFTNTLVIYYNKDIFDRFGEPYPKNGMTWDEIIRLSSKLTRVQDGVSYLGFASSVDHIARMNQFSLPVIDPKTGKSTMGNEKWKQLYQTIYVDTAQQQAFKDWYSSKKPSEKPGMNTFVKEQNLAMFVFLADFDNTDMNLMNWDMVSLPTFKELPGVGSQSYPFYMTVTSTSENKEAAMEVIKYLISDEYQLFASKLGFMSILKNESILNAIGQGLNDPGAKGKNVKAMYYNKPAPIPSISMISQQVGSIFTRSISDVVLGRTDLNTYIRETEEQMDKKIDELNKKQ
ncbi:MAG: extracellular solute-binding protein family 1, partial [Paenibacillus sp.]|nr:extracellular solute-binding protein family 1 [Paenibacillus sp.]